MKPVTKEAKHELIRQSHNQETVTISDERLRDVVWQIWTTAEEAHGIAILRALLEEASDECAGHIGEHGECTGDHSGIKEAIDELVRQGELVATGEFRRNRNGELEPVYVAVDAIPRA